MTQCIIVYGNPVDGFRFVGPYDNEEAAIRFAERRDEDWWVAPITLDVLSEVEKGFKEGFAMQKGPYKVYLQNGEWVVGTDHLSIVEIHADVYCAPGDGNLDEVAKLYADKVCLALNQLEGHNENK